MRVFLLFCSFIIGGALPFVWLLYLLEPSCSENLFPKSEELFPQIESQLRQPYRASDQSRKSEEKQHAANPHFSASADLTSILQFKQSSDKNTEAKREQKYKRWYDSGWWKHFFCEAKIGDVAIAYFTYCLVVVGAFQAWWLKRSVDHMHIIERAHVSGGANFQRKADGSIESLIVTINNYGKSPAFIGTVAATICEEAELGTFPGWKINHWTGHQFAKGWKGYVFGQISGQRVDIIFPFEAGKVIAGRIWYRDIFKRCHSVGFVLTTDQLTAVGAPRYWDERKEQNLGPAEGSA
jgi:hypothetical protein